MEEVSRGVMLWVTGAAGALSDYGHRRHLQGHTSDGQSRNGGGYPGVVTGDWLQRGSERV